MAPHTTSLYLHDFLDVLISKNTLNFGTLLHGALHVNPSRTRIDGDNPGILL